MVQWTNSLAQVKDQEKSILNEEEKYNVVTLQLRISYAYERCKFECNKFFEIKKCENHCQILDRII